jgi:hypothetical protein
MYVVAAGMIHEGFPPVPRRLVMAGISKTGLFFHRQRVPSRCGSGWWGRAVAVDRNQPGLAHALGDGKAQCAHFAGKLRRRTSFLETQFGMRVNVLVQRQQMGVTACPIPLNDANLNSRAAHGCEVKGA